MRCIPTGDVVCLDWGRPPQDHQYPVAPSPPETLAPTPRDPSLYHRCTHSDFTLPAEQADLMTRQFASGGVICASERNQLGILSQPTHTDRARAVNDVPKDVDRVPKRQPCLRIRLLLRSGFICGGSKLWRSEHII